MDMLGLTEKLVNCIIRPPRSRYSQSSLGEPAFQHQGRVYQRLDFSVPSAGCFLQCSLYQQRSSQSRPTVIYLHANSSSRPSVKNYLQEVIPHFDLLSFDFRGCGLSTGKYLTLGYLEKEDVRAVIEYLHTNFGKRPIMLWGRSMGATTALLYAAKYRGVCAVVADSPFADLEQVIHNLANGSLPFMPGFMVDAIIDSLEKHCSQIIGDEYQKKFNIRQLKPIDCVGRVNAPIFFVASKQDELVDFTQVIQLYEATSSYKELELLQGGHNEGRPVHLKQTICQFLHASLKMQKFVEPHRRKIFAYTRKENEHGDEQSHRQSDARVASNPSSKNRPQTRSRIFSRQEI